MLQQVKQIKPLKSKSIQTLQQLLTQTHRVQIKPSLQTSTTSVTLLSKDKVNPAMESLYLKLVKRGANVKI